MEETIRLRGRWGARKETADECAGRMLPFLQELAECDDAFAKDWLKCAATPDQARANDLEKIELSFAALQKLLEGNQTRHELTKAVIEELGFKSRRLWNGDEQASSHIYVECGAYPNPRIIPAANVVWVDFPNFGPAAERILNADKLRELVTVVARNWDPDWVTVSTYKMDTELYSDEPYVGQSAGWFTYISGRYGQLPELPSEFEVNRIADLGHLILIPSIKRITASDPEHVSKVRSFSEILKRVGMLSPVPGR